MKGHKFLRSFVCGFLLMGTGSVMAQALDEMEIAKYKDLVNLAGIGFNSLNLDERSKAVLSMDFPAYWDFQRGMLAGGLGFPFNFLDEIGRQWYNRASAAEFSWLPYNDTKFYEVTHKKYSGYKNSFQESLSKTAANMLLHRVARYSEQKKRLKDAKVVKDTVTPVFDEHLLLLADRQIDLHYQAYKKDFTELVDNISAFLSEALTLSNGKYLVEIAALSAKLTLITEEIMYYHQTGASDDLENSQRQAGYEDCLSRLKALSRDAMSLKKAINQLVSLNK